MVFLEATAAALLRGPQWFRRERSGSESKLPFGPVQMLVLEFDSDHMKGEILPEVRRLEDADIIRLIDLLIVQKHDNGEVEAIQDSDLTAEESMEFGALAGALVGFGAGGEEEAGRAAVAGAAELEGGHVFHDAEVFYLGDMIPNGSTAAVVLIEHRGRSRSATRSSRPAACRSPTSGSIRPT